MNAKRRIIKKSQTFSLQQGTCRFAHLRTYAFLKRNKAMCETHQTKPIIHLIWSTGNRLPPNASLIIYDYINPGKCVSNEGANDCWLHSSSSSSSSSPSLSLRTCATRHRYPVHAAISIIDANNHTSWSNQARQRWTNHPSLPLPVPWLCNVNQPAIQPNKNHTQIAEQRTQNQNKIMNNLINTLLVLGCLHVVVVVVITSYTLLRSECDLHTKTKTEKTKFIILPAFDAATFVDVFDFFFSLSLVLFAAAHSTIAIPHDICFRSKFKIKNLVHDLKFKLCKRLCSRWMNGIAFEQLRVGCHTIITVNRLGVQHSGWGVCVSGIKGCTWTVLRRWTPRAVKWKVNANDREHRRLWSTHAHSRHRRMCAARGRGTGNEYEPRSHITN